MADFLPCPFCGSDNLESGGDDKFVGVRCLSCDATGPNHYGKTEWNTRPPAPPATVTVEQLAIRHLTNWGADTRHASMLAAFGNELLRRHAQGSLGCADIAAERQRQISEEGWTAERDDHYWHGKLASAALCYVYAGIFGPNDRDAGFVQRYWPWHSQWWKPSDTRRNLVKAGALIAAEIDRLDRASALSSTDGSKP